MVHSFLWISRSERGESLVVPGRFELLETFLFNKRRWVDFFRDVHEPNQPRVDVHHVQFHGGAFRSATHRVRQSAVHAVVNINKRAFNSHVVPQLHDRFQSNKRLHETKQTPLVTWDSALSLGRRHREAAAAPRARTGTSLTSREASPGAKLVWADPPRAGRSHASRRTLFSGISYFRQIWVATATERHTVARGAERVPAGLRVSVSAARDGGSRRRGSGDGPGEAEKGSKSCVCTTRGTRRA
mmetsp:Transcript_6723/g.22706  ORF Transcript_6723/g.22706 Transcript_6723/m.22706 type:complete len:243 (-) Transcript_6723:1165-1893(-)